jgi:hypothetical protein
MNKILVPAPGEMRRTGNTKVFSKKPLTVSICPPQIPRGPTWDTTQAAVKGWQPQPWHDQINFNCNNTHFGYLQILPFPVFGK